jgi:SWI/SNF-related matrix-associated actin-dependent regulator of chromatin subfamily A3
MSFFANSSCSYENSIVGCRRPEKLPEDFGGIIADEMGLGKTLTMISAIATTTEQAHRFQYDEPDGRSILDAMRRARATLVIYPAVRELFNLIIDSL